MAVIEQYPYIDNDGKANDKLVKHYSDEGKLLVQLETGREYEEAVDNHPCPYTYAEMEEANKTIPDIVIDPDEATDEDYQAALAEMGVKFHEEN